MKLKSQNTSFGLDVGQTTARIISLARSGRSIKVAKHLAFNIEEEGILDETELYSPNGLGKWLKEKKLEEFKFCMGMPQYICTTRVVNDFAKGTPDAQLQQMVRYETMQLAGLSEESFLSDYQIMKPAFGVENPVLIGFCREMAAEDVASKSNQIGLKLEEVAMNGLAAVNALLQLHPEVEQDQEPELVMDIGTENSTVVVIAGGNVLFTGSLMFGAKRFTQALSIILNSSEQDAEKIKATYTPDWENQDSPFLLAARQLDTELRSAIDNWRTGELQELANAPVSKIWLCGGGSETAGLTSYMERTQGCPVATFGPSLKNDNGEEKEEPAFAVAYGLALQSLGAAKFSISLAPALLKWQRNKEEKFVYLATAVALFFITVILSMAYADWWIGQSHEKINEGMDELRRCDSLVPKLDTALAQIEFQQKQLIPFVEQGGRSKTFMRAIEEISKSMADGDWCIYITDEFSQKDYGTKKEEDNHPQEPARPADMFGRTPEPRTQANDTKDELNISLSAMPLLGKIIIAGYTSVPGSQRYEAVLSIQNKLNACGMFQGVDWLSEDTESTGREAQILQGWNTYLKNNKQLFGEHTEFKLKLPLVKKLVNLPPPQTSSKKSKSAKKVNSKT